MSKHTKILHISNRDHEDLVKLGDMSEHTKEPWHVVNHHDILYVAAKPYEGHPYFNRTTTIEIMSDEDYPTKEADARRIVACVNACAGIATRDLETKPLFTDGYMVMFEEVTKQRDELLAMLKEVEESDMEMTEKGQIRMLTKMREIIAKVEKS